MKRALIWLIGVMLCLSVARGGDVKITVVTSAGEKGKPTTVFTADTPEIWATFKTKGAKKGDKLRGEWIADEVGEAAPAHTKIFEKILTLEGDTDAGYFTFLKPTKGWPPGKYHLDIYAGDELTTTVKFTIEGTKQTETPPKESAGGDIKITAVMATGPKDKPTTIFAPDTPEVFALLQMKGVKKGDKLRAVWFADDVGGAAPAPTKMAEKAMTMEGDPTEGNFSCSKPPQDWPAGKYHVDIYANDELATTAKFTVEGAKKTTEKPSKKDAAADDDDAQYTFKVKNENVQRITKLLASEDGKKYLDFDIGKGIDVGETMTLK
ncbi:MAG: hypothetical protein M3N48_01595, partial [Verrucomicrobiota bacterium]|nr:hypothetical protein [Verrucomicrobiota bacterium]